MDTSAGIPRPIPFSPIKSENIPEPDEQSDIVPSDFCNYCNAKLDPFDLVFDVNTCVVTIWCRQCRQENEAGKLERKGIVSSVTTKTIGVRETPARQFSQAIKTPRRLSSSSTENMNQCAFCLKPFSDENARKLHMSIHEMVDEKKKKVENGDSAVEKVKHWCSLCNRQFTCELYLIAHIEFIHHRQEELPKKFQCKFCEYNCNSKSNLIVHERLHTGDKPYKCQFCEKRFYQKSGLTRHTRKHTGEKPYSCEICKKSYSARNTYVAHYRRKHFQPRADPVDANRDQSGLHSEAVV